MEGYVLHYSEYAPGMFQRRFALSELIARDRIEAVMKAGVLHLHLPKAGADDLTSLNTTIMVEDERIEGNSTVMSKLDISSSSLRLEVNPEAKLKAFIAANVPQ